MDEQVRITLEAYNKHAKRYCELTFDSVSQYQLTEFVSLLPGRKILDVGCGSGRDTQYFAEDGFEAVGVDFSEQMVAEAKKRTKSDILLMDFSKLEFPDGSFDGIWACAALIHTPKRNLPQILSEFVRVLKPRGVLYISVREGDGEKMISYKKLGLEKVFFSYYRVEELNSMLRKAGFEVRKEFTELVNISTWVNIFARKRQE